MSSMAFSAPLTTGSPLVPPTNRQLGRNPLLPGLPNTGDMDSQYLAEEAQLRANVARQYADVLQQLGWTDENGNFIPGSISVQAGRQLSDLQRASDLATEDVTNQAQQSGTLFSGRRALDTARAQFPYQQQIARINTDVPVQLGGLYEQAAGLVDQYSLQNNLLLASMAQRRAAAIAAQPAAAAGAPQNQGGGDQGGGDQGGGGGEPGYYPGVEQTIPGTQGSTETVFSPYEQQQISQAPNVLVSLPSDHPILQPKPKPQQPAGYGGGRTSGQVARNR